MTPILSFSEVAIAENVRLWNELAVSCSGCWAAALPGSVPVSLIRNLILPATKLASCSRVSDAEYLADAGFGKVILTGRLVDSESLARLRDVAERTQLIVVIDHFRHAELLSQYVAQSGRCIQVLIEVDTGRQSTGVRPGPDASRLAAAALLLPGLEVIGVFASVMADTTPHVSDESLDAIVTIAEHALRSIRNVCHGCREIFVAVASICCPSIIPDTRIDCLIVSPIHHAAGNSKNTACESCVSLIATVISRPTLEWCVIDAGTIALGHIADASVYAPSGATILHAASETTTLLISGEASDLRIGDLVRIHVRNPERLLNSVQVSRMNALMG